MAQVEINAANIRNHHIYLTSIIYIFPMDSIGGSNSSAAGVRLKISYYHEGLFKSFESDIDGDKNILRKRGLNGGTKMLLTDLGIKAGDILQFKKITDYHFEVSLL